MAFKANNPGCPCCACDPCIIEDDPSEFEEVSGDWESLAVFGGFGWGTTDANAVARSEIDTGKRYLMQRALMQFGDGEVDLAQGSEDHYAVMGWVVDAMNRVFARIWLTYDGETYEGLNFFAQYTLRAQLVEVVDGTPTVLETGASQQWTLKNNYYYGFRANVLVHYDMGAKVLSVTAQDNSDGPVVGPLTHWVMLQTSTTIDDADRAYIGTEANPKQIAWYPNVYWHTQCLVEECDQTGWIGKGGLKVDCTFEGIKDAYDDCDVLNDSFEARWQTEGLGTVSTSLADQWTRYYLAECTAYSSFGDELLRWGLAARINYNALSDETVIDVWLLGCRDDTPFVEVLYRKTLSGFKPSDVRSLDVEIDFTSATVGGVIADILDVADFSESTCRLQMDIDP